MHLCGESTKRMLPEPCSYMMKSHKGNDRHFDALSEKYETGIFYECQF